MTIELSVAPIRYGSTAKLLSLEGDADGDRFQSLIAIQRPPGSFRESGNTLRAGTRTSKRRPVGGGASRRDRLRCARPGSARRQLPPRAVSRCALAPSPGDEDRPDEPRGKRHRLADLAREIVTVALRTGHGRRTVSSKVVSGSRLVLGSEKRAVCLVMWYCSPAFGSTSESSAHTAASNESMVASSASEFTFSRTNRSDNDLPTVCLADRSLQGFFEVVVVSSRWMERNPAGSRSVRRVTGLTSPEADERLRRDCPNVLPTQRPPPAWRVFAEQFVHFFAIMLWAASGLAVLAGMGELGVAITLVVAINGVFAFVQEYRAERAAERLRDLLPKRVAVRRDGATREIDATELVVDDVVLLGPGDRVSADLEIVNSHGLRLDISLLTGESTPESVEAGETAYAGTFVLEGEATGIVRTTGSETRLGEIAALTRARATGDAASPRDRPSRPDHRDDRRRGRRRLLRRERGARDRSGCRRPLRDRRHGRTRPRRAAPERHDVARRRSQTPRGGKRARAATRVRRDARLDDVHLYGQDRDAHTEPNGRRRGVDAGGPRSNRGRRLRSGRECRSRRRDAISDPRNGDDRRAVFDR
ncbi:cation-transporting P-type ATPase [Natronococcus sp. JC468]|nr:cation-transporting P-type ATPase [Natronococcus sp. JC468]